MRSTNKSATKIATKDDANDKDLSGYEKSESDISFREYQREEKEPSNNSKLSYISK